MTLLANDPLTQLAFSIYENKGVFALLLGSGLSRAAEIPTGWEITLDLVRRVALAQGADAQQDWAQWYRDATNSEPNYSLLLKELASSPEERRAILHGYIEPTEADREVGRKIPTKAHHAIASLVRSGYIRVIITTNFDRLMENALREAGIEPTVISSVDALAGAEPLTHSQCYLLKLHGDYKDARILNTEEELSTYPQAYDRMLDRIFDEYGLVVCGWSGEWDVALRAAFLRAPNRRYPTYWAARGDLGGGASEIVSLRSSRVLPIKNADAFFSDLGQRVETISVTHRQNPLSIDLLVNSTKRYLSKPEYRIHLEELFADETHRLVEMLESPEFAVQGSCDSAKFVERVQRYESISEPLARMVGVVGCWGGEDEFHLIADLIASLYRQGSKVLGGLQVWLRLRNYPAALMLTAYGIGLTRSKKWSLLHRLITHLVSAEHVEPHRIVDKLFLTAWDGGHPDYWHLIPELEQRKTPLSDHLYRLFQDWSSSFAKLEPDFELLYERFEMLCSLAQLESTSSEEIAQSKNVPHRNFVWTPLGRVAWHTKNLKRLADELRSDGFRKSILAAGFAEGRGEVLEIQLENLERMAARMAWP
jgi:hypothetical protein